MAQDANTHRENMRLHPKVAAGGVGSLIATLALWLLSEAGVNPPPDAAAAITGLIVALFGYIAPRLEAERPIVAAELVQTGPARNGNGKTAKRSAARV